MCIAELQSCQWQMQDLRTRSSIETHMYNVYKIFDHTHIHICVDLARGLWNPCTLLSPHALTPIHHCVLLCM